MAPEIDQTVFSWSDFLLKLSRRQRLKQFIRPFHVGLPPPECRVDERLLGSHSFTCLPFGRIVCPQSSLFLSRASSSSKVSRSARRFHCRRCKVREGLCPSGSPTCELIASSLDPSHADWVCARLLFSPVAISDHPNLMREAACL